METCRTLTLWIFLLRLCRDTCHRDIVNLQVEMVRQFYIQLVRTIADLFLCHLCLLLPGFSPHFHFSHIHADGFYFLESVQQNAAHRSRDWLDFFCYCCCLINVKSTQREGNQINLVTWFQTVISAGLFYKPVNTLMFLAFRFHHSVQCNPATCFHLASDVLCFRMRSTA